MIEQEKIVKTTTKTNGRIPWTENLILLIVIY